MSLTIAEQSTRVVRRLWWGANLVMALMIGGVAYTILLRPLWQDAEQHAATVDLRLKFLRSGDAIRKQNAELVIRHRNLVEVSRSEKERIPSDAQEAEFLSWVSLTAAQQGLQLRDFRPGGSVENGQYLGMAIHLQGAGSYEAICKFLDSIRHGPRMTRVVAFEITAHGSDREQLAVSMQLMAVYSHEIKANEKSPSSATRPA